jgi:amino acid transporter
MLDFLDMSGFWSLAQERPFTAWLLALSLWIIPATIQIPFVIAFKCWNRWLRNRNLKHLGWPRNPLMDADGDIVHPPVKED